jgi:4-diphosphocytidyl-2-C-methyl-D-erythritol kinase
MRTPPKTQGVFRFRTPAKITPFISILGRRNDGFHEVRVALTAVSIYDTLTWQPSANPLRVQVEGPEPLGPETGNLVYRASVAFEAATGIRIGGLWRLTKAIPAGAGLGGGSGNAAGTLVVLNRLNGGPLSAAQLHVLAAQLGSDVPYFLDPRPQWGSGRGEQLLPLAGFPRLPVLVIKPAFSIATAEAYGRVRPREGEAAMQPPLTTLEEVVASLNNDFERVLSEVYPELAAIKTGLLAAGARGALLSGSGSAVFGLFASAAERDAGQMRLTRTNPAWLALACDTLPDHDYAVTLLQEPK